MRQEDALARQAIAKTLTAYNSGGDRGRVDDMTGAFVDDAGLETTDGRTQRGASRFAPMFLDS